MEEDFYINYLPGIKFDNSNITLALKDIAKILEETQRNDYRFLCAIRQLIKDSSHGNLILSGHIENLKYSWVSSDYTVITILQKLFGFSVDYIEKVTRIINKFLILKPFGDVAEKNIRAVYYVLEELNSYTISKLKELLPLSIEQIKKAFDKKDLTYKSTVKEIREYVKSIKGTSKEKVIEENDNEEESEITDCGQYVKFSSENFEIIKNIVLDKSNSYKDTSSVVAAMIEYFRVNKIKL